jgi:hypothetical protein
MDEISRRKPRIAMIGNPRGWSWIPGRHTAHDIDFVDLELDGSVPSRARAAAPSTLARGGGRKPALEAARGPARPRIWSHAGEQRVLDRVGRHVIVRAG